jgi:CheY-like chemotaxis protein
MVTMQSPECAVVLRVELAQDDVPIVTHSLSLSEERIWVVLDVPLELHAEVHLQVSFPGLLSPMSLRGRVEDVREASGPGAPRAVALGFVFHGEAERRFVERLLANLRRSGSSPPDRAPRQGEYRVLVIDDNNLIREMFAYGIEKYFYKQKARVRVDLADDAERAWTMMSQDVYDLVIVDYFLPLADGAQLVARMRRETMLARTPVVAISVGGDTARDATLSAGADMFLSKPVVMRDLFSTLARLTTAEIAS